MNDWILENIKRVVAMAYIDGCDDGPQGIGAPCLFEETEASEELKKLLFLIESEVEVHE
jgi:hypothetical protein